MDRAEFGLSAKDVAAIKQMRADIAILKAATKQNQRFGEKRPPRIPSTPIQQFRNNTGETIPAYGVFAVDDVWVRGSNDTFDLEQLPDAIKPDGTPGKVYAVNKHSAVQSRNESARITGIDACSFGPVVEVLYDPALEGEDIPANGDRLGPVNGEWFIGRDSVDLVFFVLGVASEEKHTVLARMSETAETGIPIKSTDEADPEDEEEVEEYTCPPYGVLTVDGYDEEAGILLVKKTTAITDRDFVFNGPDPLPPGGTGKAQDGDFKKCLYDDNEGEEIPTRRQWWGPKVDEWHLVRYPTQQIAHVAGIVDESNKILLARQRPNRTTPAVFCRRLAFPATQSYTAASGFVAIELDDVSGAGTGDIADVAATGTVTIKHHGFYLFQFHCCVRPDEGSFPAETEKMGSVELKFYVNDEDNSTGPYGLPRQVTADLFNIEGEHITVPISMAALLNLAPDDEVEIRLNCSDCDVDISGVHLVIHQI